MRRAGLVAGLLIDLLGAIWLLQGTGVLGGSPMTGDTFWAGAGLALIVAGSAVAILSVLRGSRGA